MLVQTTKLVKKLRQINQSIEGAIKIDQWVETFLDQKRMSNQPVVLITPWSLSVRFFDRYQGSFSPTKKERKLFQKEIPKIGAAFTEFGFQFEFWIAFSRGYLDERLLPNHIETEYVQMIQNLCDEFETPVILINWEVDVLQHRHEPSKLILENPGLINQDLFKQELERWKKWIHEERIDISSEKLIKETTYQVACEANEGLFLMENNNPLCDAGQFLFLILGRAERYNFFSTLSPEFRKRIVAVLKPYPWRL